MTKEKYLTLQEDYIEHILEYVKESGSLFPHISIFADIIEPKDDEIDMPGLVHIPINDEYMNDEKSKDEFVNDILPSIFKSLKTKFKPIGIAWASEAWMKVANKDFDFANDDWKKLATKKEVIIINIESEFNNTCITYEIKRMGTQVNSDGELTSCVELEKLDDMGSPTNVSGRFTGLFKKLKD